MADSWTKALSRAWRLLLIEYVFLKSCHINPTPGLAGFGAGAPQRYFEPFLASLFYVRAVSLLDDALEDYIFQNNIPVPKKYRGSFDAKIKLLSKVLLDDSELHRIRKRRNELVHEHTKKVDWDQFESDLSIIEKELQNLKLVRMRPKYEYKWERGQLYGSDKPGIDQSREYKCVVTENDNIAFELKWTENIHSS